MEYNLYRDAILKMWNEVKSKDFAVVIEHDKDNREYVLSCLCDPNLNVSNLKIDSDQQCPFDIRIAKNIDISPCMDNCHIFTKTTIPHKLQIVMSKFMTKFITKEGIDSIKSLAKACRTQKGVSKEAAADYISVTEKVISSTSRFGGFEFNIESGNISAKRRQI